MRNDEYLEEFHPLGTPQESAGTEDRTEMEVSLYYSKGGYNAFTGNANKRGLYLSFWPVARFEGGVSRTLFDDLGRRVLIEEMGRKSKKKGEGWADKLEPYTATMAYHAERQEWGMIGAILREKLDAPALRVTTDA